MAAHYKKLMAAKAAVDSTAPKSLHTSVKCRVITVGKWSPIFDVWSEQLFQDKERAAPLCIFSEVHFKDSDASSYCKKDYPKHWSACFVSQTLVYNSSTDRSSASPLLQSRMHLGSHNRKKAFQSSFNKTHSGDLLDKHSIYFTEKKKHFTPQILNTSHQSFLVKHRYYNPPPKKKSSSPGRPSLKSADINNENKRELHRFLEDAHVRPHSDHFSPQPVENHDLWIPDSKMPLSPGSQLEETEEEYLRFLQDLTNAILIRSCCHEEVLEDVFQMHIKSKRHNLDEVKKRRIVESLKKALNITYQPDPAISCKGAQQKDASISATCF